MLQLVKTVPSGHARSISTLKFSPNGTYFSTSSADGTVRIFSVVDTTLVACLAGAHERGVSDASWSPDSAYLATASDDKTIAIWSIEAASKGNTSEPIKVLQGHNSYVYCCNFSPSGSLLASGGFDDCLKVWDVRKGRPFLELAAHGDPVTSVSFSDDSSMVLTSSYDGLIRLWDSENGRCLKTLVDNDNPAVAWACFTPNSRYILTATLDSCLRLWCPTTGRCLRTFSTPGFTLKKFSCAAKIAVRSDKLVLFAGSEDGFIYYWDLASKQLLGCTQVFSDSPVLSLDIFESTLACAGIEQNCGPADSGKSGLLHSLNESLPNACLIDCLECATMTVLYERILSQLTSNNQQQRAKRNASAAPKLCSTSTDFVTRFNSAIASKVVLLLDEVERLIQVDSNALSVLLRLPEMNENVSIVCCSREDFSSFGHSICTGLQPVCINLPSYTEAESTRILISELTKQVSSLPAATISTYVQTVQQVASPTTKDLDIWRSLCWSLIQSSSEPYKATRLPRIIQDKLDSQYRPEVFYRQSMGELDILQKYLLVAAYIASFQTAKDDVRAFGSELLKKNKQRRAPFNPAKAKENADIKLNVKLPKMFDQTRLIAIFYFLFQGLNFLPSIPQLQMAIRSLCDRGFLRASPTSLRYRVNISKDFAQSIASSLEIDLKNLMNN